MNDVNGLGDSINKLGDVKGMGKAEEMAAAMTDQSERLSASWYVIRAAFGAAILPAFNDFVGMIADMGKEVVEFTQKYPELTKWIGYAGVAILGLVAAGGLLTLTMGVATMTATTWGATVTAVNFLTGGLATVLGFLKTSIIAVNMAFWASPIGLIVGVIAAVVIAVGALIYYWDELKAAFLDIDWMNVLTASLEILWGVLKKMFAPFEWLMDQFDEIFTSNKEIEVTQKVKSIDAYEQLPNFTKNEARSPFKPRLNTPQGGITQQIANANNQKSTSIGVMNINSVKDMDDMESKMELYAG